MCLLLVTAAIAAGPPTEQSEAVIATVNAFHKELERGDEKAVLELLAPDAVILENGYAETRGEYERDHLKEDITFTRAVRSTRSISNVQIEGNVAWVMATNHAIGSFRDRQINSIGTELMVLTKSSQGWRIRAIHWSSHDNKKSE
jgi:ketosteroid isomerase-like protein